MRTSFLLFLTIFLNLNFYSQVTITSANYSQNFGTTTRPTWTDNSTFPGWYLTAGGTFSYGGTQNITAAAPTNTGGFYTYQCNSDGNIRLGSRPSNTTGGSSGSGQSHIGLRLINNTGQTIESIDVSYRGFQLSLAENGTGNTNSLTFSYRISATPNTSLTAGSFTSVAALNYNAPNNSATAGSNQVNGFPGTISSNIPLCVNTPSIANGSEIMLRWTDINNTNNDHHLAIDDVQVFFNFDNACAITLPVELLDFKGACDNNSMNLSWSTASERNNDFFKIEASRDGTNYEEITKIKAEGNSSKTTYYNQTIENNNYSYLKLSQKDFDGKENELKIIALDCKDKNEIYLFPNPTNQFVNIQNLKLNSEIILKDATGKTISIENNNSINFQFDLSNLNYGIYFIKIINEGKTSTHKLVYTH